MFFEFEIVFVDTMVVSVFLLLLDTLYLYYYYRFQKLNLEKQHKIESGKRFEKKKDESNHKIYFCFKRTMPLYIIHLMLLIRNLSQSKYLITIFSLILSVSFFSLRKLIEVVVDPIGIVLPRVGLKKRRVGAIKIGKIMSKGKRVSFKLSLVDLRKHMFVSGLTGMGKTNFIKVLVLKIVEEFSNIPFLLVEFKGEYENLGELPDIQLLSPGKNFWINIFNPGSENTEIYAEKLLNLMIMCNMITLREEFSAQMEKVLSEVLISVCSDEKRRNWEGFEYYLDNIKKKYANKIPYIEQTAVSIENRIRRLKRGPLRNVFTSDQDLDTREIQQTNTIIDLSQIIKLGGNKADAVFLANVVFNYIWVENLEHGKSETVRHITIIEDSIFFSSKSNTSDGLKTGYLEDIALLLRGTGECLININTRPTISEDIMANAGVVVSFQLSYDQNEMGRLLALQKEEYQYLTKLRVGQCIIKVNSIKTPFMLEVPKAEMPISVLSKKNRSLKIRLSNFIKNLKLKKTIKKDFDELFKENDQNLQDDKKMSDIEPNKPKSEPNKRSASTILNWNKALTDCENLFLIGQYHYCMDRCGDLYNSIIGVLRELMIKSKNTLDSDISLESWLSKKSRRLVFILESLKTLDLKLKKGSTFNEDDLERYLSLLKKILLIIKIHKREKNTYLEIKGSAVNDEKTCKQTQFTKANLVSTNSVPNAYLTDSEEPDRLWDVLRISLIKYENQEPQ